MKARFEGDAGRRLLVEALSAQKLVSGDTALAEALADVVQLHDAVPGTRLIQQGGVENSVFFLISGSLSIVVNGKTIATRHPNDHVGEMAAILPALRRSATVLAAEPSVVGEISEPSLADLAQRHPAIWRRMAAELARRLEQRNHLLAAQRPVVRVFVISSVEALEIARAIQNAFAHDSISVVVWTDGIFKASNYPIEALEREVDVSDFAIAIATGDDIVRKRHRQSKAPRDNVIFELGFFMGRLGRHRSILFEPRQGRVALPSDLTGITSVQYCLAEGEPLAVSVAPACNQIRDLIRDLGPNV